MVENGALDMNKHEIACDQSYDLHSKTGRKVGCGGYKHASSKYQNAQGQPANICSKLLTYASEELENTTVKGCCNTALYEYIFERLGMPNIKSFDWIFIFLIWITKKKKINKNKTISLYFPTQKYEHVKIIRFLIFSNSSEHCY